MRKRSTEILQRAIESKSGGITILQLLQGWKKSEKTLRNDIQEILDYFQAIQQDSLVRFDGQTLSFFPTETVNSTDDIFKLLNTYHYKMSLEERKIYIIIKLLHENSYISMQQLAESMSVTRNTIINDCRLVNEYLKKNKISFIAKNKKGIKVTGKNEDITFLLIDIFTKILPSLSSEKSFFVKMITHLVQFKHSLSDIHFSMELYTKNHNIIFAKESFHSISISLFVLINRIEQFSDSIPIYKNNYDVQLDAIGSMIKYVLKSINHKYITKEKIISLESIILSGNITHQVQNINDFELYSIICHFLLEISRELFIHLQSDELLIQSLISHIKNMHNWNNIIFDINEDYGVSEIFIVKYIADKKFIILENYLQYKLNTNMKNSIIIHICSSILRNRQNMNPYNIIISCPGSMATSKYLEAQIKNYFNFTIVDIMTTDEVEKNKDKLKGIDFIISTVEIKECSLPVIVVSPWITIEDINKIQQLKLKNKESHSETWKSFPLFAHLYSVYQTANKEEISYINKGIESLIDNISVNHKAKTSFLLDILHPKYIRVKQQCFEWKKAMELAAEDLIKDGFFSTNYLQEAIENIEEYGAYIIISNGIALAHASKTSDVYEDGISLLVVKEGIYFSEKEKAYLLFFFSQKSEIEYPELFRDLIKLGEDPSNIDRIKNSSSNYEVYQKIEEITRSRRYETLK